MLEPLFSKFAGYYVLDCVPYQPGNVVAVLAINGKESDKGKTSIFLLNLNNGRILESVAIDYKGYLGGSLQFLAGSTRIVVLETQLHVWTPGVGLSTKPLTPSPTYNGVTVMGDAGGPVWALTYSSPPGSKTLEYHCLVQVFGSPKKSVETARHSFTVRAPVGNDSVVAARDGRQLLFHDSVNLYRASLAPEGRAIRIESLMTMPGGRIHVLDWDQASDEAFCFGVSDGERKGRLVVYDGKRKKRTPTVTVFEPKTILLGCHTSRRYMVVGALTTSRFRCVLLDRSRLTVLAESGGPNIRINGVLALEDQNKAVCWGEGSDGALKCYKMV